MLEIRIPATQKEAGRPKVKTILECFEEQKRAEQAGPAWGESGGLGDGEDVVNSRRLVLVTSDLDYQFLISDLRIRNCLSSVSLPGNGEGHISEFDRGRSDKVIQ